MNCWIEGEATSFDWIVQDTGSTPATYKRLFIPNPFSSDEENEAKKSAQQQEEDAESARRQRNYEKLQGFRNQLDTSIRKKLSDSVDEIKKIYENKVIPFENTDDSYKSKMSAYYSEWSSIGDKFSDAGNAIRDFLAGIGDSLVDTVKGLLTLVVDLGILYADARWKSIVPIQVPEVLDQEVEKIKQKYEPLLKDPVNTIGGIGQSICDTADEKGVAYSSGYIVTEVVTALLADKGLDKLKNVAKTGKTADNVADIAEGAAKGAGNAAEDAGKAGKGLEGAAKGAESAAEDAGKVVESGGKTFKFSDMTESEIVKIVERYRKKAPIEIPDTAKYKAKSMADGYEQISYKWNDGTYKYEVRWHTRTSGAPEGQGNTWVIQRTIPGNGGKKPSTQFLIGENEWVEGWKWYDAISARKNGTATQEQIELLDKGHWKE